MTGTLLMITTLIATLVVGGVLYMRSRRKAKEAGVAGEEMKTLAEDANSKTSEAREERATA
ncbi:MAG: hypothetical protein AAFW81_09485 [Pseudomonadota bacterium]